MADSLFDDVMSGINPLAAHADKEEAARQAARQNMTDIFATFTRIIKGEMAAFNDDPIAFEQRTAEILDGLQSGSSSMLNPTTTPADETDETTDPKTPVAALPSTPPAPEVELGKEILLLFGNDADEARNALAILKQISLGGPVVTGFLSDLLKHLNGAEIASIGSNLSAYIIQIVPQLAGGRDQIINNGSDLELESVINERKKTADMFAAFRTLVNAVHGASVPNGRISDMLDDACKMAEDLHQRNTTFRAVFTELTNASSITPKAGQDAVEFTKDVIAKLTTPATPVVTPSKELEAVGKEVGEKRNGKSDADLGAAIVNKITALKDAERTLTEARTRAQRLAALNNVTIPASTTGPVAIVEAIIQDAIDNTPGAAKRFGMKKITL
jgi:hypothetical protein